jgi:hypothetical protein
MSRMTRNEFCAKRSLIALAATLCLIFPASSESARAGFSGSRQHVLRIS